MKTLSEKKIIQIMREEWESKIRNLQQEVDVYYKAHKGETPKNVVSVGLKVRDKSGLLFTVDAVRPHEFVLRSPEGKRQTISDIDFEKHFEQD